ncbi:MAG: Holliday junction branch migration protein RuvA [Patescibacteria group bacterium]
MIAFLRGIVADKDLSTAVIDVNGVGYSVFVSSETYESLAVGQESSVSIYEHIKEDAHDLYGFTDNAAKDLFSLLISVNGVGPKMGIALMNIGSGDQLRSAIATGDVKYVTAASGVGKKLAERVILDLKDKVGLVSSDDATSFVGTPSMAGDEAIAALTSLGFTAQDAANALQGIDSELDIEERIRLALKGRR